MNKLFPIFVKLEEFSTLLVGGGNVGLEKLEAILANSPAAPVTLVAPFIKPEIEVLAAVHPSVILVNRVYHPTDLAGKDLVICATDNKALHQSIRTEARALKIWVNVADTPELCDFYLSSVVRKGDLKIAISTNGMSPTFAKRLKETLNEVLTDDLQNLLQNLKNVRDKLKGDFNSKVRALNELTKDLGSTQDKT